MMRVHASDVLLHAGFSLIFPVMRYHRFHLRILTLYFASKSKGISLTAFNVNSSYRLLSLELITGETVLITLRICNMARGAPVTVLCLSALGTGSLLQIAAFQGSTAAIFVQPSLVDFLLRFRFTLS
jgi:hypothetical protein